MSNTNRKAKNMGGRLLFSVVLTLVLAAALVLGTILLVSEGYVDMAMERIMSWGEDGTLERFQAFVETELVPWCIGMLAAAGAVVAALTPILIKLKNAKEKLDEGTDGAAKTYEAGMAQQATMQAFMEEMRRDFTELKQEQRASLAADRASIRRIEEKVDGVRRMEVAAFGASSELVKKGVASKVYHICEETECSGTTEGGDGHEIGRDDGEATEEEETRG